MSTIEARWVTEAMEWAPVEARHAEMHYLRRVAIFGARAIMDHVGVEELCPKDSVLNAATMRNSATRQSKLIHLDSSESAGSTHKYARIQESHRDHQSPNKSSRRILGHIPRIGKQSDPAESAPHYDETGLLIIKFGGEHNSNVMDMMSRTDLDVRKNLRWSPEAMTDYYQKRIDEMAAFIGALDELAQVTQTYIYPLHIGEELEDRQADS